MIADAVDTATSVRAGEVSALEAVTAAISQIEVENHNFGFLVAERFEHAVEETMGISADAPLAGVPVLVKDAIATVAGLPLTEGSRYVRDWVAPADSEYVARLKAAGAIVLGSATCSEFAATTACEPHRYGPTGNPNAPGKTSGGSSGGSAAAVACGAVPAAHGSDAGGSIRLPAACCGVVGFKPSWGLTPLGLGYRDLDSRFWCEHVVSRSVRDSAAFLEATSHPSVRADFRAAADLEPPPMRAAISTATLGGATADPQGAGSVELVAGLLVELGHQVVEGNPSFDLAAADDAYFTVFSVGLVRRITEWRERLRREPVFDDFEPYTWALLQRGRATSPAELAAAEETLDRAAVSIHAFYDDVDLWVAPTLGGPPFDLGYLDAGQEVSVEVALERDSAFSEYAWPQNVSGQPSLSVPVPVTADRPPSGVQLTGRRGADALVLSTGKTIERCLLESTLDAHSPRGLAR